MSNVVIEKIENVLTSEYSVQNYIEFIQEVFDSVKLVAPDKFRKEYTNFSSHIAGASHIGNYVDPDGKKLIIFSVQLLNETYVKTARSTQRNYAKKLIENAGADGALIAFYTEGDLKWRISFVRLDYEIKFENGKLKTAENITPAKRYSYLVGKGEPCHTAIDRFRKFIIDRNFTPNLDELEEAFSVEAVTNEFFNLYCEKFKQLLAHLEDNPDFVIEAKLHNFTAAQFAKKLMGQIVFLYFLQKKGWLGVGAWPNILTEKEYNRAFHKKGTKSRELIPRVYLPVGDGTYKVSVRALDAMSDDDEAILAQCVKGKPWGSGPHNFMRKLFELAEKKKSNFFDDYLEPLFYNALNVNRGEQGYDPDLHCRIPFLSGGLFEPIDGYDWEHNDFAIPNEVFSNRINNDPRTGDGILDIFDRYNFTMSEDEPMEREVAIDPEMLGKVFENLLEVNDRKAKGAFYTPREIVHYMCQESLINYLTYTLKIDESDIRDFILYGDFMKDADTEKTIRVANKDGSYHMEFDFEKDLFISEKILSFKKGVNRLADLDKALAEVRIADPAVGSGAFPLGMLNEIVRARQNISAYMSITMSRFSTRMMYTIDRSAHNLKYETIRNCIYAADIEPSAVDIAQLRLWLSLVIDDEINPEAQDLSDGHRNPLPLPNLECNILCGNSLIDEFEKVPLINYSAIIGTDRDNQQMNLYQSGFDFILPKLIDTQDKLFRCSETEKKKELLEEISALKDMIVKSQFEGRTDADVWNHYEESKQLASKPYVLWQLDFARVFKEKGGFDIVIGNPPYVGESGHKEIFRTIAATAFGEKYYQGKMDLFYFFFHKGIDLLHKDGFCSLITTNYFLSAAGAKTLRNDFKSRANILKFINFNELKIFQSALGQHNIITFLQKTKQQTVSCCITNRKGYACANILNNIVQGNDNETKYFNISADKLYDDNGTIAFREEDAILTKMKARQNYFLNKKSIGGGIDILQESVVEKHLSIDPSLEVGSGIFAVETDEIEDLGFNEKERLIIKPYFTSEQIKKYIIMGKNHKWILYTDRKVCENIKDYPNVRAHFDKYQSIITSDNKPYGLHRPRVEEQFKGTKILSLRMTREPSFTLAEQDTYVTRAYLTIKLNDLSYKYALALFNSKLFYYWLFHMGKRKGKQLQVDQAQLSELPIYVSSADKQKLLEDNIETLRNRLLEGTDSEELIAKIDRMVYDLYELDDSEIAKVEAFVEAQRAL